MSGHSKWATIKHKKAKEDSKRGKTFTKLVREITVAAREGGGESSNNARLRLILEKAKEVNMPQDNIVRAIKKGTGELGSSSIYEAFTYEGYGPHGIAVMLETLSDNKNRTVSDIRHIFTKYNGNLAESGAVAWMFEHKGIIRATGKMTEDELIEKLLDHNIDNVQLDDDVFTITCKIQDVDKIKKIVSLIPLKIEAAQLEWVAKNPLTLTDKTHEEIVCKFLETIDDMDDVQNVYANLGD